MEHVRRGDGVTRPAPGAWATLSYRDADAALRYLADVVGFRISVVYRGDDERPVAHAELLWPDGGGVMIGSEPATGRWPGGAGAPGTTAVYLSSDSVAALAGRVRAAGWRILRSSTSSEQASDEVEFLDPEGNVWSVGTYRGAQT